MACAVGKRDGILAMPRDLRAPLRASDNDLALHAAIDGAIAVKPKGHDFVIDRHTRKPAVSRHMSVTGG